MAGGAARWQDVHLQSVGARAPRHQDRGNLLHGLVQTANETNAVCTSLLRDLRARKFTAPHGLLVVRDGAKTYGTPCAVYDHDAAVQRYQ